MLELLFSSRNTTRMSAISHIRCTGSWSRSQCDDYLDDLTIPVRLACVASSGYPVVFSLWYVWDGVHLWCAVQKDARTARYCRARPRCGFEVAADSPPYRGVRGSADVSVVPEEGERILRTLLPRYLGSADSELARWLLSRVDTEVALRLTPVRLFSWDYSRRMQPAVEHPQRSDRTE